MTTTSLHPSYGRDALPFVDRSNPDRPIIVHTYRPATHQPDDPIVIVQHGMLRNGGEYRDFWIDTADKHRVLIAAPTFANEMFPDAENYNNGMVLADGVVRPRDHWLYGVPDRVFAALRAGGATSRRKARLFGHSAGGQFAHRMLATGQGDAFDAVMAANPGWYTLPTLDRNFPEGLGGLGFDRATIARWLAWPMTIFAGDQDIDTADPNLPAQPEALAQGPTRFARAGFIHAFARAEAERLGLPFAWKLIVVPGIGHDGAAMSRAAAALWFEGRIPSAAELATQNAVVA